MSSASRRPPRVVIDRAPSTRQPSRFLWLYALAWAGGAVAYVPFLTILLPVRVAMLEPAQQVEWLAYMTFCGALAASISAILFGWLSDYTRTRQPWIATGLVLTIVLFVAMPLARDSVSLLLMIVLWQTALNMMLGPLAAWAADHVPPSQLGSLGGLLAFAPALGSAAGALVTIPGLAGWDGRMAMVAALVAACVLPALFLARPIGRRSAGAVKQDTSPGPRKAQRMELAAAMWLARFLVQISEAALFAYLYYFFRTVDASLDAAWIAQMFGIVLALSVPVALIVGRWSDRNDRPMLPLIATSIVAALSLAGLAAAHDRSQALGAYVLFGIATTTFLSLHSAQTFRVLRHSGHRGRNLGFFNLTNTGPSLIMPWLTIAIVPQFGFSRLFLLLAGLALLAALILATIARPMRRA